VVAVLHAANVVLDLFRFPEFLVPVDARLVDVVVVVELVEGVDVEQMFAVLSVLLACVLAQDVQLAGVMVHSLLSGWSSLEQADGVVGRGHVVDGGVGGRASGGGCLDHVYSSHCLYSFGSLIL